jgi:hypothetical protein
MKTKTQTKQRTQLRDFDVAMLDCKNEFGDSILDDSFLDEEAFALTDEDDD